MSSAKIIIIGGGVIGLSTAYHLARRRAGHIVLLEKGRLGDGSSSRAAGIGTQLMWSETGVRARQLGFRLFREYSAEWDEYTFHDEHGCLNLFNSETWPDRTVLLPLYDRLDVPYEVLDAKEIRYRWPALNPPDDFLGLHDPRGGYSEPDEYIAAISNRVRKMAVQVIEGEVVVDILRHGERVTGVRTKQRQIEADAVISTVHVWSLPLWRGVNLRLPMKHFVHQRYVTAPLSSPFVAPPVNADPYFGYLRPAAGNRMLMGVETADREEFRVHSIDFQMGELTTPTAIRDDARRRFVELAPALKDVAWESQHVGLISFSSDGEPILGEMPQFPGLFVAASFHSGGFSYNAAAGSLMAQLVTEGRACIDLAPFSPARFGIDETELHLKSNLRQRQAIRRRH